MEERAIPAKCFPQLSGHVADTPLLFRACGKRGALSLCRGGALSEADDWSWRIKPIGKIRLWGRLLKLGIGYN